MYRACIHCCRDLGQNGVIEPFPIGRRLAFDSAKGRLWVVCPHCARWNLTPLEERWEAVEECERRFRGLRLRAQTSNIGLARLPEGLELVRIGKPLRPEFAAWRYGREFTRRRRRNVLGISAVGLAVGGVAIAGASAGPIILLPWAGSILYSLARTRFAPPPLIDLPRGPGRSWEVMTGETLILPDPDDGWRLSLQHHFGRTELAGDEAQRWLSYLLARVNRTGGSASVVSDAVKQIEATPPRSFITSLAEESGRLWESDDKARRAYYATFDEELLRLRPTRWPLPINRAAVSRLPLARRVALEMALHESTEQRAIDGELAALEAAWREAEEIAGIADDLLLPDGVRARVAAAHAPTPRESGHD